jgi:hypothetical protein
MHYANGRKARNGDRIMRITLSGESVKSIIGILYEAAPGNYDSNGYLTEPMDSHYTYLSECLHVDDVVAAIGDAKLVPDTSKKL